MKYILLMFFLMPQLVCAQAAQQKPTKLLRKTTPKVITQHLDTIKQTVKQNVIKKSEMVNGSKTSLNAISPKKKTDYAESDELKANAIKDINNTKKSLQEKSEQALERSKQVRHSFDTPKDEWKSMTKKLRDSASRGELTRIVESEGKTRLYQSKEQIKGYGKQAKELKSEFKKPIKADFKLDNNGSSASSENLNSFKSAIDAVQKTNGLPPNSNGVDKTDFPPPSNLLKKDGMPPSINEPINIESPTTNLKNDLLKLPQQKMDSLSQLNLKNAFDVFPNFVGTTKILSEKRLRQLKDSIGGKKFDSLFNIGQQLVRKKEIGREDLLKYINSPVAKEAAITPSQNFDQNTVTEEIKTKTQDNIKDFNLHELELPRADLEKLPPLSGNILDSKYVGMLDSLKNKSLSKQDMSLLEKKLDKRYSEVIFKNKPKFWDKGYFDGVVGVIGGENATIVQISPNLGYHISPAFSLGIGPIISLQQQNKSFNTNFGVRSFAKLEVYKQLGYVQVEHQLTPVRIDYENVNLSGNVLIGGGLVKKIYNKIAVNFSLLYRIHSTADIPGVSPWVFRLGISSVNF